MPLRVGEFVLKDEGGKRYTLVHTFIDLGITSYYEDAKGHMRKLISYLKFYLDVPTLVALIVFVVIFRAPLTDYFIAPSFKFLSQVFNTPEVATELMIGTISSVIAAIIFTLGGFILLQFYMRNRLSGTFDAFDLQVDGKEEAWGKAKVVYRPWAPDRNGVPVKLLLTRNDIILQGRGLIVNNRYLVGHYTEISRPERRRSGVFLYELDGSGQSWRGQYLYVDPDKEKPAVGKAVWKRV